VKDKTIQVERLHFLTMAYIGHIW